MFIYLFTREKNHMTISIDTIFIQTILEILAPFTNKKKIQFFIRIRNKEIKLHYL